MTKKTKYSVVIGLASAALVLSACSSDGSGDGDTGASGSLTIACGAMEDLCQEWTKTFSEETGISTNFVRLSSGETVARLAAAKDSPEFDVWHGGPVDGFGAAVEQGLLEAYESPNASMIPDEYQDPNNYWTGVYVGALGFCSNEKVLADLGLEVPQSWEDLLDPALSTQISTAHPSTSGTAFTTLWTQVERLGSEEAGMEYMAQLHNNILQYSKSGTAPGQIAGRGEVAVGLVFSHDCVKYIEEGMEDLVVSFPSEGTGYEIGGSALVANSKNVEAAKQYLDWTLTAEAQSLGPTVGSFQILTNPDAVKDDRMVDLDSVTLVDYDFAEAANRKPELTAEFDEDIAAAPKE